MNVDIRDNDIRILTDKETAQELGARYVDNGKYSLPKTLDAANDLLKYSNNIELKLLKDRMEQGKSKLLTLRTYEAINLPGYEKLRPYQRVDVHFLSKLPHAAIFNEQRTGRLDMSRFS